MFSEHIQEKLKLFKDTKYRIVGKNEVAQIEEKSKSGRVVLQCTMQQDALVLNTPEQNVLPWLDGDKKGARACADAFVFTQADQNDLFDLHIMEFKKSINTATLDKSKWQLAMGLYNARAVAGFLGIHIRNIRFYSGYRRDEITDMDQAALIQLRASNHGEAVKKMNDWKKGICRLQVDGKSCNYQQDKIRLDDNGYGTVILS